jgi:hypothetical protein
MVSKAVAKIETSIELKAGNFFNEVPKERNANANNGKDKPAKVIRARTKNVILLLVIFLS